MDYGKPVLFATDVSPAPEFVLKVAASFNSRVFEPNHDMSEREKFALSRGFAFENMHERDAIACAIKAYHGYANKFRQIEALLKSKDMAGKEDQVKAMVLDGFSVQNALLDLETEKELSAPQPQAKPQQAPQEVDVSKKNEKIRELLHSNSELKKAIERLESERKLLQGKMLDLEKGIYERVLRDKEIRKRESRINVLSHVREKKQQKKQSDLKALGGKRIQEKTSEEKKVDIDSIIMRYRQKSLK